MPNNTQNNSTTVATPEEVEIGRAGLDETTIESYGKVIVGESRRVPGPNSVTCPICLSDYHAKDTLRYIPQCQHCFHSHCVDEWLRLRGSCPICRTSPSPATLLSTSQLNSQLHSFSFSLFFVTRTCCTILDFSKQQQGRISINPYIDCYNNQHIK